MKIRDLFIALSSFIFMASSNALPIFTQLEVHESLRIEVNSTGCFHNSTTIYDFNSSSVAISEVKPTGKIDLGIVELSPIDIADLDRLMNFYSTELGQGCTSSDAIKIQKFSNGKVTSVQTVVDGSCSLDRTKYLTFYELKARLSNPPNNEI